MSLSIQNSSLGSNQILTSWDYAIFLEWLINGDTTHSNIVIESIGQAISILTITWDKTLEGLAKKRLSWYTQEEIQVMMTRIDALENTKIGTPLKNMVKSITDPKTTATTAEELTV
jgi:hypothetical protein